MASRNHETDVIIIGAGLSGLMAARTLQINKIQFVVLEAQHRVGGRVLSTSHDGCTIDLGAQFVSPHQTRIQRLLQEYGLSTYLTYNNGTTLYAIGDKKKSSKGKLPPFSPLSLLDLHGFEKLLKKQLNQINPLRPWESSNVEKLDSITMEEWLEKKMFSKSGKALYRIMAEENLSVSLSEISVLDVLWGLKSTGSLENDATAENAWITEGAQTLPIRMAQSLGDAIKLNEPVTKIQWSDTNVQIFTSQGEWLARKVIMAIPPTFTNRIEYEPPLPSTRDLLCQRVGQGSVIKCLVIYPSPFWRQRGESGMAFYDKGPVKLTIDSTKSNTDKGVLIAFINGEEARKLGALGEETRKAEVLKCLHTLFGQEALNPIAYYEKDWSDDPWARGGYAAHFAPGVLTQFGEALMKPIGPIHWAGTETATEWRLYMEGALEAGERAAFEVIAELDRNK